MLCRSFVGAFGSVRPHGLRRSAQGQRGDPKKSMDPMRLRGYLAGSNSATSLCVFSDVSTRPGSTGMRARVRRGRKASSMGWRRGCLPVLAPPEGIGAVNERTGSALPAKGTPFLTRLSTTPARPTSHSPAHRPLSPYSRDSAAAPLSPYSRDNAAQLPLTPSHPHPCRPTPSSPPLSLATARPTEPPSDPSR